jgi:quinone-modifying oxidoreductase subunit QmoC
MTNTVLVQPDAEFIHGVLAGGGADLKKCMQCATCSAVCSLAAEERPFPRRQVVEAQWGMKDQLLGDPAVWLCHNCGDCTTRCPRGARPGDIMGAIRQQIIQTLAFPRFMGKLVGNPDGLAVLLFGIPVMVLALLAALPRLDTSGPYEFAQMFPQARLEALFFTISGLVLLAFIAGAVRFVRALRASGADGPILPALGPALFEIVTHRRFAKCTAEQNRRWGHLLVLLGFVGLGIMGTIVGVGTLTGVMHTPLPLLHPLKVFANLCAVLALIGVAILLYDRLLDRDTRQASTYFDWFFLLILAGAVLTGILSEVLRLAQAALWMYTIYFVHLALVFTLFLYAPYSKFAHFLYRTIAMAATWRRDELRGLETRNLPAVTGANSSS